MLMFAPSAPMITTKHGRLRLGIAKADGSERIYGYSRTLAIMSANGRDAGEYLIGLGLARAWVK